MVWRNRRIIVLGVVMLVGSLAGCVLYYHQIGRIEFYRRHHVVVQTIQKTVNLVYFPYKFKKLELERFDLTVGQDELKFLNTNLPEIYQGKILTEEYRQKVDAKFMSGGQEYQVKVRYRGETDVHWRDPKKSWLVDFGQGDFGGMKEIHLVLPRDRDYILSELNLYRVKKMGLLVPETRFVNFFVNGYYEGVYWMYEGWSQEFLSRHGVKDGSILYSGLDELGFLSETGNLNYFDDVKYWRAYTDKQDFSELQKLIDLIHNPDQEYFNREIGKIIDLDNFLKWQVSQCLVVSTHQSGANVRMYFDSATQKIKFIPWEISIGQGVDDFLSKDYNPLVTRVLANPDLAQKRNQMLWDYVSDAKNLTDDLHFYDQMDKLTKDDFYQDWNKVESNVKYREGVKSIREQIGEIFYGLRRIMQSG